MKSYFFKSLIICSLAVAVFSAGIIALQYYPLISAGRAYEEARYDDAVKKLAFAFHMHQDSAILNFNMGTALYKTGDYQKAAEFFRRAANSDDADLSQKAQYNMGNCRYRSGEKEKNRDEALSLYRKSLDHYQKAMAVKTGDEDAKFNINLVEKKLKENLDGVRAQNGQKPGSDDRRKEDRQDRIGSHGRDESADRQRAGNDVGMRKEGAGEIKGKSSHMEKETGQIKFKKGEMSREDAELLLDEFRKRERSGSLLTDKERKGRMTVVEKDW